MVYHTFFKIRPLEDKCNKLEIDGFDNIHYRKHKVYTLQQRLFKV